MRYSLQSVGTWTDNKQLTLKDESHLQFGFGEDGKLRSNPVRSECGRCQPGTYVKSNPSECCIQCGPCLGSNYTSEENAEHCSSSFIEGEKEMWGNDPLVGSSSCVPIPHKFSYYSAPWAIPSLILTCIGLLCVLFTGITFGVFWKHNVVKSSGREEMILLLIGICCSFVLTFILVAPPSVVVCAVSRLGIFSCYSLMFGALAIKVFRVVRIFYGTKHNLKHANHFLSPFSQVCFTLVIVIVQMCIMFIDLGVTPPNVIHVLHYDHESGHEHLGFPKFVLFCVGGNNITTVLSLIYETLIIGTATVLGVLSFKLPDNFNEAKYISLCTFALLVVWIGLVPTYFATRSNPEIHSAAASLFVILTAFAVLIFIFGPKLFLLLFRRGKPDSAFNRASATCNSGGVHNVNIVTPLRDSKPCR